MSGDVVADFPLKDMISCWENRSADVSALMLSLELNEDWDDILCASSDAKTVVGFGKEYVEHNPKTADWFNVGDVWEYQNCLQFFCKERNIDYPAENKMHFSGAKFSYERGFSDKDCDLK